MSHSQIIGTKDCRNMALFWSQPPDIDFVASVSGSDCFCKWSGTFVAARVLPEVETFSAEEFKLATELSFFLRLKFSLLLFPSLDRPKRNDGASPEPAFSNNDSLLDYKRLQRAFEYGLKFYCRKAAAVVCIDS
ncbi:predicted protein [Scheffersomyces stipitis CBS 6054]|uniref:Uncharacterized protein n=1 Tax=Scheffersomyces stipitis (strain ATCC 58785 / CBS 6054 / NBRC 10063 / NRRL Y-11545) TaxID=322104 RepID=A3LQ69_PICST|nr:predicted protein [Scheffersomyces stipitis CBS 6054]ABN64625.2 predicted protein [Scheffersomyces stipitis CBS 6054]